MNAEPIQEWIDDLQSTSSQQWVLRAVAFVTPVAAFSATEAAIRSFYVWGLVLVGMLALISALRPDSHAGIAVVVAVCWHWAATVDDVRTPWVLAAGISLLTFHTATALLSIAPQSVTHAAPTLWRYARRAIYVAVATVAVWALTLGLHERDARGNAVVTFVAFMSVVAAGLLLRSRSVLRR